MVRIGFATLVLLTGTLASPGIALAQDVTNIAENNSGDTAWVLAASLLALLMTLPGLALFYGGLVRTKNALATVLQIAAIASVVSVLWIVVGYTLAFGDTVGGIVGNGRAWMLGGLTILRDGTGIPESTYVLFQLSLVIFAAALMAGAWAERVRFGWVVAFTALWSLLVYAPVAHWIWGGGWLGRLGVVDLAGGLIVHVTAGVSALVVALLIGKRQSAASGRQSAHAPLLALAGLMLLWVGWFGRTGVPSLAATDDASAAILNTHLGAAVAALLWALIEKLKHGKPSATGFATGALAGLVAVTPAAGLISPGGAILTGIVGALGCFVVLDIVRNRLGIDDALGVFAINGAGGALGAISLGIFAWQGLGGTGFIEGSNIPLAVGVQALGIGAVAVYSAFVTAILAVGVSLFIPMRVHEEEEEEGLDTSSHGERGWDMD